MNEKESLISKSLSALFPRISFFALLSCLGLSLWGGGGGSSEIYYPRNPRVGNQTTVLGSTTWIKDLDVSLVWDAPSDTSYTASKSFGPSGDKDTVTAIYSLSKYRILISSPPGSATAETNSNQRNYEVTNAVSGSWSFSFAAKYVISSIDNEDYRNKFQDNVYVDNETALPISIDNTKPIGPSALELSAQGLPLGQKIYIENLTTEILSWTAGSDAHSGLKEYVLEAKVPDSDAYVEIARIPANSQRQHVPYAATADSPVDGEYSYRVSSVDNVGNQSPGTPYNFILDTLPPAASEDLSGHLAFIADSPAMNLRWGSIQDGGSGLASVTLHAERRESPQGSWLPAADLDMLGREETLFPFQAQAGIYRFSLEAADSLGNSTNRIYLEDGRAYIVPPPRPGLKLGSPTVTLEANEPRYEIPLEFDVSLAELGQAGIAGYRLRRTMNGIPGAATNLAMPQSGDVRWVAGGAGTSYASRYIDILEGSEYAHARIEYSLEILYESTSDTRLLLPAPQYVVLPNLTNSLAASIRTAAEPELELARASSSGISYSDGGTRLLLGQGGGIVAVLEGVTGGQDAEGDQVSLSLTATRRSTGGVEQGAIDPSTGALRFSPSLGDIYDLVFTAVERSANGTLLRSQTLPSSGKLELAFDELPPLITEDWKKLAPDGKELGPLAEGAMSGPTARLIVKAQEAGTDAVKSGSREILLWNGAAAGSGSPTARVEVMTGGAEIDLRARLSASELEAVKAGSRAVRLLVSEGIQAQVLWPMMSGADGARFVVAEAKDAAGNRSKKESRFVLDTMPPIEPASIEYAYEGSQHRIVATFQGSQEAARYYGKRGEVLTGPLSKLNDRYRYEIDPLGLGVNARIDFSIIAEDEAGNRSSGKGFSAYTYVEPTTLQMERGYEKLATGAVRRYHRFIVGGSVAGVQELEYSIDGLSGWTALVLASGGFLHDNLPAHANFRYRQRSRSADGHLSALGPAFEYPGVIAANFSPEAGVALAPGAIAPGQPSFSWGAGFDADGDPLSYELWYREIGGSYSKLGTATGLGLKAGIGIFQNGKNYEWYLRALDGRAGFADSPTKTFQVDAIAPTMGMTIPPGLFLNAESIQVNISDSSAVSLGASYRRSASTYNLPVINRGGGSWEVDIRPMAGFPATITLSAVDEAGNETRKDSLELRVDRIAPAVTGFSFVDGGEYRVEPLAAAQIQVSDDYAGVKTIRYGIASGPGQVPEIWKEIGAQASARPEGSPGTMDLKRGLALELVNGQSGYIALEALDWAGNLSARVWSGTAIRLDATPPSLGLTTEGLIQRFGKLFVTDIAALHAAATHEDVESGSTLSFALAEEGAESIAWKESFEAAKAGALAGKRYRVLARAVNGAGLSTETSSETFLYDPSAPNSLGIALPDSMRSGMALRLGFIGEDGESDLREFRLGIGSTKGGTELSARIAGNEAGWILAEPVEGSASAVFLLPEDAAGLYYLTLEAENGAGLVTTLEEATPRMSVNAPAGIVVYDNGPYSGTREIYGTWKYYGEEMLAGYEYRVVDEAGVALDSGAPADGWILTAQASERISSISLEDGSTYYIEARALFADGSRSAEGKSLGVKIDGSAVTLVGFSAPKAASPTGPRIAWETEDEESGIAGIAARLLVTDETGGLEALGDWISLGATAAGSAVLEPNEAIKAAGGRVIVALSATNRAGLSREWRSGYIVIDPSPPPLPVVIDQGAVINAAQPLEAGWSLSSEDPESGTVSYEWALSPTPSKREGLSWQGMGLEKKALTGIRGAHGETWYLLVRATNGAGLTSIGASDGIICDATAPFVAGVTLLFGEGTEEVSYISSKDSLRINIDATEDLSGITGYAAELGLFDLESRSWRKLPTGAAIYESTEPLIALPANIPLPEGQLAMFKGEAKNAGGEVQVGYSMPFIFDTSKPLIGSIMMTRDGDTLHFAWEVTESGVPVRRFEIGLEGSGLPTDLIQGERSSSRSLAGLGDGRYRFKVRGINVAGRVGDWKEGPDFWVDGSAPSVSIMAPAFASSVLPLEIEGYDAESGIDELEYCIGTEIDEDLYTGGWVKTAGAHLGAALELATLGRAIPDRSSIVVSARTWNGARISSALAKSSPILIDRTPPSAPVIALGAYTRSRAAISGLTATTGDQESGIRALQWSAHVAGEPGRDWRDFPIGGISQAEGRLVVEEGLLEALQLEEGGSYQVAVRAQNGAGDWSAEGLSGTLIVDSLAPTISFESGGAIVVNEARPIAFTASEAARAEFRLRNPDGTLEERTLDILEGAGSYPFSGLTEGVYELSVRLEDRAGNPGNEGTGAALAGIRLNAAPIATQESVATRPGKPLRFAPLAYDPDGDLPLRYSWDFGDGSPVEEGQNPEHRYYHTSAEVQASAYTARLTVRDALGKARIVAIPVSVSNTGAGELFADELWSGERIITGDLTVPAGFTLRIEPGTTIKVEPGLSISIAGRLLAEGSAAESVAGETWKGIRVSGEGVFLAMRVEDAERGISSLSGAAVRIEDCLFTANVIGLHAYGSTPSVMRSRFEENAVYGIKEDAGAAPLAIDCAFSGNLYDYYDEEATVLDGSQINGMGANAGNYHE